MQWMVKKALQHYWRYCRGLRLRAQGVLLDAEGQVLLVRARDDAAWRLPGDAVLSGETAEDALLRALGDVGVTPDAAPKLIGIDISADCGASGHDVLFVVRSWHQSIDAQQAVSALFRIGMLPPGLQERDRGRIFSAAQSDRMPGGENPR